MTAPLTLPSHSHTPGTARAALSYPEFRLVWLGLFASNVGTWMQNFTLPAYIDDRTHSAGLVGLLVFTQLGPLLLLSIPAGVLADKYPRRAYLVVMQAVQMVFTVVLAGLVAADAPLWTLFVTQLFIGVGFALNAPAFQASIPLLVHRQDLAGAVGLNSVMINASRVLGPSLAALLAMFGVTTSQVFLINAGTYLFLIAALMAVTIPDVRGQHTEQGWRRLLTGINIARHRRVLSRSLATMCVFSLFSLVYIGLFPSVARLNFGIDATGSAYKWLYTIWGLGACLGALSVATFLHTFDKRRLVVIGLVGFAASLTTFALLPRRRSRDSGELHSRLLLLHALHGADHDRSGEHARLRTSLRDAVVVHGVRWHGSDRQPALRTSHRCGRCPPGADRRGHRGSAACSLLRSPPAPGIRLPAARRAAHADRPQSGEPARDLAGDQLTPTSISRSHRFG